MEVEVNDFPSDRDVSMRFRISGISAVLVLLATGLQADDFVRDLKGDIAEHPHVPKFTANVDLGQLPPASEGRLTLTLTNRTDKTVELGQSLPMCACTKVDISSQVIEPGDSLVITTLLSTGKSSRSRTVNAGFSFRHRDQPRTALSVGMIYQLEGIVKLQSEVVTMRQSDSGDKSVTEEIPFFFTDPVTFADLSVATGADSDWLEAKLVRDEARKAGTLKLIAKFDESVDAPSVTTVNIESSKTGAKGELRVARMPHQAINIVPRVLRFRIGEDGSLLATALLRQQLKGDSSQAKGGAVIVKCRLDDVPAKVSTKRLTHGVHRIKVRIDRPERLLKDLRHRPTIEWNVQSNAGKFVTDGPAVLPSEFRLLNAPDLQDGQD